MEEEEAVTAQTVTTLLLRLVVVLELVLAVQVAGQQTALLLQRELATAQVAVAVAEETLETEMALLVLLA
jgi:hypothetical protein